MNLQARAVRTRSLVWHAVLLLAQTAFFVWACLADRIGIALLFGFGLVASAISDAQDTILGELRGENRRKS